MSATLSLPDQIRQLNDARVLVLSDPKFYQTVLQSLLPIIGPSAALELRRWGGDFVAEAFATPAVATAEKETMQLFVLDTLQQVAENKKEDARVMSSWVQAAASMYPLALRWTINNSYDTNSWEQMTVIKTRILEIWTDATTLVKLCCIKFAQRIILAQTAASNPELRLGGSLDVSLDKVPPNHPILDPRTLEAEAMGLLDRVLSVLQENSSDALIVDATLNCLSILTRTRPGTSARIVNALFSFNPLKLANSSMTSKSRVLVKSMEKTNRLLLMHLVKRDPQNPLNPRITQHVERIMRMKSEIFDDVGRKRTLDMAANDSLETKRQRLGGLLHSVPQVNVVPLSPGSHSLAEVFTLTTHGQLKGFDVGCVNHILAARISATVLAGVDSQLFSKAVEGVRGRLETLAAAPPPELNPNTSPLDVDDDDDDYEPDFYAAEDTEQILNKLDSDLSEVRLPREDPGLSLTNFTLPPPPPLGSERSINDGRGTVVRVLEIVRSLDDMALKKTRAGFTRLAASSYDRESWTTVFSRLAAREAVPLDEVPVKKEEEQESSRAPLGDTIRECLFSYILEDFRRRIDVAVSWLSEEWYNDQRQAVALAMKSGAKATDSGAMESTTAVDPTLVLAPPHYEMWALKLIDGFVPFLNPQDKVLTRFLGEIPEVNIAILTRVKNMCRDPSVVQLALTSLLYLVMMRPPVRDLALDTVQDIWTEFEDSRQIAGKYLQKYRPEWLATAKRDATAVTT